MHNMHATKHIKHRHKRKLRGKDAHPATPDITLKASKRCWAGIVSICCC